MRPLASFLLVLAAAGCVSSGAYAQKADEARRAQQAYEAEAQRRAALQEKLTGLQAQVDGLVADLNALKEKVRADEGSLSQKEAELRAARERTAELQALVDTLSKRPARAATRR